MEVVAYKGVAYNLGGLLVFYYNFLATGSLSTTFSHGLEK